MYEGFVWYKKGFCYFGENFFQCLGWDLHETVHLLFFHISKYIIWWILNVKCSHKCFRRAFNCILTIKLTIANISKLLASLLLTSFSSGAPAGDGDRCPSGESVCGSGQTNGSNGVAEGHRWVHLHQRDVIVIGVGVVIWMRNDLL